MLLLGRATRFLLLVQKCFAFKTSLSIAELRQQYMHSGSAAHIASSNPLTALYPEHYLAVPIDHFHNDTEYEPHTKDTFNLRYWFDATYYAEGGPVYLLSAGEVDGEERLPFLQKGIVHQLAQATGGIAVILEHRYYGKSFPVANLTVQSLRFCSTSQALADTTYFAKNVVFKGFEHRNLTASTTPYIAYGGSYAGAFVAILRKLYPDVFWGAISSSGVTVAVYDYWQYYEAARLYGPKDCIDKTQKLTHIIDNILIRNRKFANQLKQLFGLERLTHDDDFARVLSAGISGLQDSNWDPEINSPEFSQYCGNVSSELGGYGEDADLLINHLLNYVGYVNVTEVTACEIQKISQNECFSNYNSTFYAQDDITQEWRAWPYQYCKEWGYMQTGSGVPKNRLPLVSRLLSMEYSTIICREAFNITTPPNTAAINKYGGFNFSFPRVALLDGEADPWRGATPHAIGLPDRESTTSEPFLLIDGAVHHWDENGRFENETTPGLPPPPIRKAQELELDFVKKWLWEWNLNAKTSYFADQEQEILEL